MNHKAALKKRFLVGFFTILPAAILIAVALWLYKILARVVSPVLGLVNVSATVLITLLTVVVFLLIILLVGTLVLTPTGKQTVQLLEQSVLQFVPGYKQIKRMTDSFQTKKITKRASSVVLVDLMQNGTYMTGFVTDQPSTTHTTVFVPTGPNPTSGLIYHVPNKYVFPVKANAQDAFESIIAVGKNSKILFKDFDKKK